MIDVHVAQDWVIRPLAVILVLGVVVLGALSFRAFSRPDKGEVRGSPVAFGSGILCLVWVVVIVPLGLFASDLTAPGQLAPWLMLVLVPLGIGALMILSQLGVLARFDRQGVEFRTISGRRKRVAWTEFRRVRQGQVMWSGAVFELERSRPFLVSSNSRGATELMMAAYNAKVPGVEVFIPFPPDDSVS